MILYEHVKYFFKDGIYYAGYKHLAVIFPKVCGAATPS